MNLDKLQNAINDFSQKIGLIQDIDSLLEEILSTARTIVNADAGTFYIKESDTLQFKITQNDTLSKKIGNKLVYNSFAIPIDKKSIAGYVGVTKKKVRINNMYDIPKDKEYRFNPDFDKSIGYKTVSTYTFPLLSQENRLLGVLQLINAKNRKGKIIPFNEQDANYLYYFINTAGIALERALFTRNQLLRMMQMTGLRDPKETSAHVARVGGIAVSVYERWAERKKVDKEEVKKNIDILRMAAMLHDVGKVGISDTILKKPAKLTEEEFAIMKTHTTIGAKLFSNCSSELENATLEVVLRHHENWDGSGYPGHIDPFAEQDEGHIKFGRGLIGREIPLFARIVSICDVYDALSSKRAYKEAWKEEDVLSEIFASSGKKFDPDVAASFFEQYPIIRRIYERYQDND